MGDKKVVIIQPAPPAMPSLLRVAAYARVSVESERLTHSLAAQISYFSDLIQKTPDWQYVGVYADEFVTGTTINKRTEFQRLIKDCEAGLIDIVLVKSISRFARNTVDLLTTVRHLKEIGVEVRFEKEKISTMNESGELMISLLAVFSQEESRSISENNKWGIRRRFQNGTFSVCNKHILGYRYDDKQKKYIIIPEEAELVKRIFAMFLDGIPIFRIAQILTDEGVTTVRGCELSETYLNGLIKNEIYAGDLKRQKFFVQDHISHKQVKNRGQLPQYYLENVHDAIIDRETYKRVLAEIDRRSALRPPVYPFSHKIVCSCCGRNFERQHTGKFISWRCSSKRYIGNECKTQCFPEKSLEEICASVLSMDQFDASLFKSKVSKMTVRVDGNILFEFTGGREFLWKNRHLNDFVHLRTSTDAFKDKIFCQNCGKSYSQVKFPNHLVYWCCKGRRNRGGTCRNPNCPDNKLREITAIVMGDDEFCEEQFIEQIDCIRVCADGNLFYHFKDGSVTQWDGKEARPQANQLKRRKES